MAVSRQSHGDWPNSRWPCGSFEHVHSFRRATAMLTVFRGATAEPRRSWRCHCFLCRTNTAMTPGSGVTRVEGPRFWQLSAVLRGSMTEPLHNHGDHGDATAVTAVQHHSGTAPPVWRGYYSEYKFGQSQQWPPCCILLAADINWW